MSTFERISLNTATVKLYFIIHRFNVFKHGQQRKSIFGNADFRRLCRVTRST